MKKTIILFMLMIPALIMPGQVKRVYDESIDPAAQIAGALAQADKEGKHVICQVGGNWCRWCLMFADFITKDHEISKLISDNYIYLHVNYPREGADAALRARLGNPERFGFPSLVVLDGKGNILHIQDSSFLESGEGYDRDKVIRFLKNWTPEAIK